MEKKKLLIVSDSPLLFTGLSRCVKEIFKPLSEKYEIRIAGWHHQSLYSDFPTHIYPIKKGNPRGHEELKAILDDFKADLFLGIGDLWDFGPYIAALDEAKEKNPAFKALLWVTIDGEFLLPSFIDLIEVWDEVVAFSKYGASELEVYDGRKHRVIYPGVRKESFYKFKPKDVKFNMGKRQVSPDDTFIALAFAQNTDRKNLPATINAFSAFCRDKTDALLLMLTDPSDPNGYDLWSLIAKNRIKGKVVITKDISPMKGLSDEQVNLLFNVSNLNINSSIGEGAGLPLIEAQATGLIPMATDYAAAPEMIEGVGEKLQVAEYFYGLYGIKRAIVLTKDITEKLEYYYNLWKKKDKTLEDRSKLCIKNAEKFSWDKTANQIDEELRKLSEPKKPRAWIQEKFEITELKTVMVVPSWAKHCGIAEYSRSLAESIETLEKEDVVIFPSQNLWDLAALLEKQYFSVVHFQHEFSFWPERAFFLSAIKMLREKFKARFILTLHSYSLLHSYNKIILENFDKVIVHCEDFKERLKSIADFGNIEVIPIGCQTSEKFSEEDMKLTKDKLRISGRYPIVGSFGFLRKQKGFREIAASMISLKRVFEKPLFFLYAPLHEFGSYSYDEEFFKFIEREGLEKDIMVHRDWLHDKQMLNALSCVDIFVLNYKASPAGGGNSAAVKTLMRLGKPIITTDTIYFRDLKDEVIKEKFLSPKRIAELVALILKDESLLNSLRENERKYLEENDWQNIARRHIDVYTT